jgi:gamma-glutamyltranspeptidase/glutathione hydrolase
MTIVGADGQRSVVDYFGRAPQAATPDMYELTEGDSRSVVGFGGVRDEANAYGPRSVLVPGMVAGMALALDRFGTIALDQAVAPAVGFAADGFPVDWYRGLLLSSQQATIRRDPETERIFSATASPPPPSSAPHPPASSKPTSPAPSA